jgi:choline dehydrogenase
MQFAASQPVTLYKYWNLWGKAWVGAQWLLTGKGASARRTSSRPAPSSGRRPGSNTPTSSTISCPSPCAMTARRSRRARLSGPCRADAVEIARVGHLRSGAPRTRRSSASTTCRTRGLGGFPRLHPPDARDLRPAGAFKPYLKAELQPGPRSDRRRAGRFPARTCRKRLSPLRHLPDGAGQRPDGGGRSGMPGDRGRGAAGRRQSIFPQVTNGNLNGPSIMTGRKGRGPHPWPDAACRPRTWSRGSTRTGGRFATLTLIDPGQGFGAVRRHRKGARTRLCRDSQEGDRHVEHPAHAARRIPGRRAEDQRA